MGLYLRNLIRAERVEVHHFKSLLLVKVRTGNINMYINGLNAGKQVIIDPCDHEQVLQISVTK